MTYVKAYLIALGRLLAISGAALIVFRLAGVPDLVAAYLVYLSIVVAVAGPIEILINGNKK